MYIKSEKDLNLKAVWGKGLSEGKNITLAFVLDMQKITKGIIVLSAASCYKVFADGIMLGFGPNRAAHGFARLSEYHFSARYIVVEVHSHYVETFCWIKQKPFFACRVESFNGQNYYTDDFACYIVDDRLKKVQRYSFQRGFAEIYRIRKDSKDLCSGKEIYPCIETEIADLPKLLSSYTNNPLLNVHNPISSVASGVVLIDKNKSVWRDRAHTEIEGYSIEEWEDSATDDASRFDYKANSVIANADMKYETFDFSRAITGFIELEVKAEDKGVVYVLFDEILNENGEIDFTRNETSNVIKWNFEIKGIFNVSSFEPYTARYVCIVCSRNIDCAVRIRDYENPDAQNFSFDCNDERVNRIMTACLNTFSQNSVDILTDCPSRERAGWLSDSWFSSVAELIFTGENKVEKTFLENYIYADCSKVSKGLLPMCYPSDMYYDNIPNWSMWYILEIVKYANIHGKDDIVERSRKRVCDIIEYFTKKENEFGLLEDLDGWVFVEWSVANDASHICGVNVPSNMCYAACLAQAGELYGFDSWVERSQRIRKFIKEHAFDGKFFVDNLVRDKDNKLVCTSNYTEVCQYYAFWFDCVSKGEYPDLFCELINNLGCNRKDGYLPWMGKPNVMYGIYMRIDLLMRNGDRKGVLDECMRYFLPMAEKTGTLWEHNDTRASCVHGFASYVARWLIYAVKGYDVLDVFQTSIKKDCLK